MSTRLAEQEGDEIVKKSDNRISGKNMCIVFDYHTRIDNTVLINQ